MAASPIARILAANILLFTILSTSSSNITLNYPAIFNFGDSNSDTGGLAAGIAFPVGLPNGQTYFNKPAGRFCDGRLIIDFLVDQMGMTFLNPYLDSVGAPSFQNGCNFATGGATITPAKANSVSPFSFGVQVSQFSRFKAKVVDLLAKGKSQKYLPSQDSFRNGLYTFDIGQNDLDGALSNFQSGDQLASLIQNLLSEFETLLKNLYNQGARKFWIHNTGPLGCLPRIIATYGKDPSKLDQTGCVSSHNTAATIFNTQLRAMCTRLPAQFQDANITYVDIYAIKLNLITNFSQFGFKQSIAACCGYGGPPLNFDTRINCGETKNLNGSMVTAMVCNNTAEYINWDGNHYTEAANQQISLQILSGNYTTQYAFNKTLGGQDLFLIRSRSSLA